MALDEALFQGVASGSSQPTIRFYGWRPPAVSIGYGQAAEKTVNFKKIEQKGYDFVRRPSGGGAVLHDRELTYSVAAGKNSGFFQKDLMSSYLIIGKALLKACRHFGIQADFKHPKSYSKENSYFSFLSCFEVSTPYEIISNEKKLIGSAQRRGKNAVIQHGSVLLDFNLSDWEEVFSIDERQGRISLKTRMTSLTEALQREITPEEASPVFKKAFEDILNRRLIERDFTEEEREKALKIKEKYDSERWRHLR